RLDCQVPPFQKFVLTFLPLFLEGIFLNSYWECKVRGLARPVCAVYVVPTFGIALIVTFVATFAVFPGAPRVLRCISVRQSALAFHMESTPIDTTAYPPFFVLSIL